MDTSLESFLNHEFGGQDDGDTPMDVAENEAPEAAPTETLPQDESKNVPSTAPAAEPQIQESAEHVETPPTQTADVSSDDSESIQALRLELDNALGELAQLRNAKEAQATPAKYEIPTNPSEVTSIDWLNGEHSSEFFEDPEKFNLLLNKVFTVASRTATLAATEQMMMTIPEVVASSARQQIDTQTAVRDFYTQNPDLEPFKKAMSVAYTQVHAENNGMSITEMLAEAGKRTRAIIRLRQSTAPVTPQQVVTAGGGAAQARKAPVQLTALEAQIDAMMQID